MVAVSGTAGGSGRAYYSRAIETVTPSERPRRSRRGSAERPIDGRVYRGAWIVVAIALLVAALSVRHPSALPAPQLPPSFDGSSARADAVEMARYTPSRFPGTAGAA